MRDTEFSFHAASSPIKMQLVLKNVVLVTATLPTGNLRLTGNANVVLSLILTDFISSRTPLKLAGMPWAPKILIPYFRCPDFLRLVICIFFRLLSEFVNVSFSMKESTIILPTNKTMDHWMRTILLRSVSGCWH